jgi:DNA (cytosine-5)-methyltransferase 1
METMIALDLFCGAGGASVGLRRLGIQPSGVDIESQPRYPFSFLQADATSISIDTIRSYDFVWASPPCQGFTAYKRRAGHVRPRENLIPKVRAMLRAAGVPYVIENVPDAPLENPFLLCGSAFGLDVRRHRIFEASFPVTPPICNHGWQTPRFPPATNRKNLRSTVEVGVWRIPLETQRRAMGIDWMQLEELSEAIPPAYSEFIARAWLANYRQQSCVALTKISDAGRRS